MNHFLDMMIEEYKKLLDFNASLHRYSSNLKVSKACVHDVLAITPSVDWRSSGAGEFAQLLVWF